MDEELKVKSLAKALKILECFSVDELELGITDISKKLGLNKSNVHNIVSTFVGMGYLQPCPNGKYTLGLKLLEFAFIINKHLGFQNAIYDVIFDLSNKVDEIVHFGIPWNTNVLYLHVIHPVSKLTTIAYRNTTGLIAPLYATGIGRAILAEYPEESWPLYIPDNRIMYTEKSLIDIPDILEELAKTKKRGFSIDDKEKDHGVRCVGMPVYNQAGKLTAGISISGSETTMTDDKLLMCAEELSKAVALIKERLYM